MTRLVLLVLSYLVFCPLALAGDGDIVISRAVVAAPPSLDAPSAAAYFTIENHGAAADVLTGIATPVVTEAMLHETTNDNGVMRMNMLDKIEIPPGGKIKMAPAKLHVMLVGEKAPYTLGAEVPFDLVFAKAGALHVVAKVVSLSTVLNP